ncbi:LYR motif-containing protein 4-like [Frankliniella occidentalis]|uniref:LYR motif-containing protein 4-like n=1 Tax=Frankliniella occidentalis TaxID=133901 RepID=A0A6J1RXV9_FRAOC|nr:LYR motif-containing protein 4-like [Frankliniella occidentalis]
MASLRNEVLRLYKSLLREGSKFSNYNFRMYALRKVRDEFKEHKLETDPKKIEAFLTFGKENLDVVKRQVMVANLYRTDNLVIERKTV